MAIEVSGVQFWSEIVLWFQIELALFAHLLLIRPNCIPLSSITIINCIYLYFNSLLESWRILYPFQKKKDSQKMRFKGLNRYCCLYHQDVPVVILLCKICCLALPYFKCPLWSTLFVYSAKIFKVFMLHYT